MSLKKVIASLTVVAALLLGAGISAPVADADPACGNCSDIVKVVDCDSIALASCGSGHDAVSGPTLTTNNGGITNPRPEIPEGEKHNWKREAAPVTAIMTASLTATK